MGEGKGGGYKEERQESGCIHCCGGFKIGGGGVIEEVDATMAFVWKAVEAGVRAGWKECRRSPSLYTFPGAVSQGALVKQGDHASLCIESSLPLLG